MNYKIVSILILLFFPLVYLNAQNSLTIGKQIWMTENLDVDHFQNGDIIREVKSKEEW